MKIDIEEGVYEFRVSGESKDKTSLYVDYFSEMVSDYDEIAAIKKSCISTLERMGYVFKTFTYKKQ